MEFERLNQQQFDRFCDFIYKKSGIRIHEKKVTLLSNRIRRRLKAGGFENYDTYYQFLMSAAGKSERESVLAAVTTNETFFFRTERQFDWLKTDFLAELVAQQQAGLRPPSLRILSAGCASGDEPYSIAMCLAENRYRLRNWSLTILGADISDDVLRVAEEGKFKPRAVEGVTERQRRRYFRHLPEEDVWEIREEIKNMVQLKQHNLIEPFREPAFDCIFIRNVLIYFDSDSKQLAINNLINALAVGGYLVVGPSEGVYDMLDPLEKVAPLLYRKVEDPRLRAVAGNKVVHR